VTQLAPAQPDASPTPPAEGKPTKRKRRELWGLPPWVRDVLEVVLIAFILYVIIWNALQTVRVDGTSMVGTLQDKDLLLASKVSYDFGLNPSRGDIVILIPPSDPSRDFIKRVIGLPGDIIEIDGSRQPTRLLIKAGGQGDFQQLNEPYLPQAWTSQDFCCSANGTASAAPQAVTVPQGKYFVMGDNRNASSDSRAFGFVPRDHILAKAFLRIWPLDHFGGLGSGPTLQAATAGSAMLPAGGVVLLQRALRRRRRRIAERSSLAAAAGS
jgi:signal peptidase I